MGINLKDIQWIKTTQKHSLNIIMHHFLTFKGIFTIRVPFFCHKTQRFCFCYFPNTKSKWNKFKWKILDNFHGSGGFSHLYVIMHMYFVKKP
jgi:hypothetical protein